MASSKELIKGRKGIHSNTSQNTSVQSNASKVSNLSELVSSDDEEEKNIADDNELEEQLSFQESRNLSCSSTNLNASIGSTGSRIYSKHCWLFLICIAFPIVIGIFAVASDFKPNLKVKKTNCSLPNLVNKFGTQNNDFWLELQSGIDLLVSQQRPVVFLYIYKDSSEDYVDGLVSAISDYAICCIKDGTIQTPIKLSGADLNSYDLKQDYGIFLHKYKRELEDKGVMIVKHLDETPGFVAQAFHTFCDEINPLVKEAMFLFTMKVDDAHAKSNFVKVEEILKERWSELDDDIFEPLYTRISNVILRVN